MLLALQSYSCLRQTCCRPTAASEREAKARYLSMNAMVEQGEGEFGHDEQEGRVGGRETSAQHE